MADLRGRVKFSRSKLSAARAVDGEFNQIFGAGTAQLLVVNLSGSMKIFTLVKSWFFQTTIRKDVT